MSKPVLVFPENAQVVPFISKRYPEGICYCPNISSINEVKDNKHILCGGTTSSERLLTITKTKSKKVKA